jgi:paraquat-inducible protein B
LSKKANPTLVGAFVLCAIGLIVVAIIALGNIRFKDDRIHCIAFFSGSLRGLDVGAPVTFRGVTIGRVTNIHINYDRRQSNYIIPVYIDIEQHPDPSVSLAKQPSAENAATAIQQLIDQGLRAQLKLSSLLTSKLYIDLDFYPNTEIERHSADVDLIEIPTLPSGLEQITQRLESLPLDEILHKTISALDGINNLINSPETAPILLALEDMLINFTALTKQARDELPLLSAELKKGLTAIISLADTTEIFLHTLTEETILTSRDLRQMLISLNTAARSLEETINNIGQLTAKDSLFMYQAGNALRELEATASSVRQLSEYLQRYPNALILGQGEDKP